MNEKSNELVSELVSACIAFGRGVAPDWQTRIDLARRELSEYIAELEEAQRWRIVANGKLPKIGIPVLFLADWGSIYEGCTYDGKTIALHDLEDYEDSDITHWMPLPGLPEVQE